jgi:hypothetical protein
MSWESLLTQYAATFRATVQRDAAGSETWVWAVHLAGVQCSLQKGGGRRGSYDPGRHTAAVWTLFTRGTVDLQEDDRVTVAGVPEQFRVSFVHRLHWRGAIHHIEATLERLFDEEGSPTAVTLTSGNGHAG